MHPKTQKKIKQLLDKGGWDSRKDDMGLRVRTWYEDATVEAEEIKRWFACNKVAFFGSKEFVEDERGVCRMVFGKAIVITVVSQVRKPRATPTMEDPAFS